MNNTEDKIIMYDSPEAAEIQTLTGWVSKGSTPNTIRFWGKDEHMARWSGCTHVKCECGHIHEKTWTKCPHCREIAQRERYNALPYKEYDGKSPVVLWDGDTYFFSEDELIDWMEDEDNEIEEVELLYCDPIKYSHIDCGYWGNDAHEDWEPPKGLQDRIDALNEYIDTLLPHSWQPGKIRTSYKKTSTTNH